MVDTFKQNQLPVGPLSVGLVLEGPTQLFHCHWDSEDCVERRTSQIGREKEQKSTGVNEGHKQYDRKSKFVKEVGINKNVTFKKKEVIKQDFFFHELSRDDKTERKK